jgi:hypothetical protein
MPAIKLIDFDAAVRIRDGFDELPSYTEQYCAPEVCLRTFKIIMRITRTNDAIQLCHGVLVLTLLRLAVSLWS